MKSSSFANLREESSPTSMTRYSTTRSATEHCTKLSVKLGAASVYSSESVMPLPSLRFNAASLNMSSIALVTATFQDTLSLKRRDEALSFGWLEYDSSRAGKRPTEGDTSLH